MIVIGEKINASRKKVKQALLDKDLGFLQQLCRQQDAAGANYIDVNVGTGEDVDYEAVAMESLVKSLEEATDKPLCIDSSSPEVIAAGVSACTRSKPMINSVSGAAARMDAIFPLAAKYETPLIALAMGENGIPAAPADRAGVCKKIRERAAEFGIPGDRFFFDPLVLPLSTGDQQGQITLETMAILKAVLNAKAVIGLSNVSFGLPRRSLINSAFLTMAVGRGLDAVILDPTDQMLLSQLRAAEVVAGRDRRCRRYTRAHNSGLLTG